MELKKLLAAHVFGMFRITPVRDEMCLAVVAGRPPTLGLILCLAFSQNWIVGPLKEATRIYLLSVKQIAFCTSCIPS